MFMRWDLTGINQAHDQDLESRLDDEGARLGLNRGLRDSVATGVELTAYRSGACRLACQPHKPHYVKRDGVRLRRGTPIRSDKPPLRPPFIERDIH
jgi:hypothetical protein